MSATSHLDMHRDHMYWRAEDDLWRDELTIWERDIDHAIKEVPQLENALRAHAESLRKHAASVRLFEQQVATHEHALAEYELGKAPGMLVNMARVHQCECEHHKDREVAHEDLKEKQHALICKWRLLFTALLELTLTSENQHQMC